MIKGRKNSLRLPQYDYSSDGAYFITVCVKDRKQLLSQIVGAMTTSPQRLNSLRLV